MPVVAAVERRRQLSRRRDVFVAVEVVRDLVRILLVHAGEGQIREAFGRLFVELSGEVRDSGEDDEEQRERADHAATLADVSRRDVTLKIGRARQLRPAATMNAVVRPKCSPIEPTRSEPTAMPVSNAQTMLPNERARRSGSVFSMMNAA